ncbi:MAG: M24 family metallopeptidase [Candidatus Levybacteria bacterium]|nr:M24 family metallopeptidase [Candidatus Levybacteria bacterium]
MDKVSSTTRACALTDECFDFILKKVKVGVSEKELATEIRKFMNKKGARLAFHTIVAFGENAYEIHHKPTNKKLARNQFVLLDFGARVNGYCADMSRTLVFGKATNEQKKIYNTVFTAQEKAIKAIKSNCKTYEIDKVARDYIFKKGFHPIPHTLGHGVGKQVHEGLKIGPMSAESLKVGDIFTIEPGIYIKNFGGVRIEDVLILQKGRARALTHSPKHLIEL